MITYNHEKFISQAIEGVLKQHTDFKIELIISDDCSKDETQSIIKKYAETNKSLIKPLYRDMNIGSMANFIETFSYCQGKYIALCEGDDFWTDPYKLQKQIDFLENPEHNDVIAVVTNSSVCDLKSNTINTSRMVIPPMNKEGIYTLSDFFKNNHQYPTLTVCFRNIDRTSLISNMTKLSNPFLGDWILWILLHLQGAFYFMNQVTAAYRINPTSLTHSVNVIKRWEADFVIRKRLKEMLPIKYHKYLRTNYNAYFKISMAYRKKKHFPRFLFYQFRAFLSNPMKYTHIILNIIQEKYYKGHPIS
jgi:glycosyltransferase involved in cell wall biosynthesis